MKLVEFFSRPLDIASNQKGRDEQTNVKKDDLFWFMLDHDKLHKDYFFPIARKLKKNSNCTPETVLELFMPMVKQGCKEYYSKNKLKGKLGRVFPKDLREEMCQRLYDHYRDDIQNEKYQIGS